VEEDREMVGDAAFIAGTGVGAKRFVSRVGRISICKEWNGEYFHSGVF